MKGQNGGDARQVCRSRRREGSEPSRHAVSLLEGGPNITGGLFWRDAEFARYHYRKRATPG
jgi:hypothetical protein